MKRIIIAALVCVVLSLIPLQPTEITLNILYGLIGVLFSVAMSLIIAFDGSKIKNSELKKGIRDSIHDTRNNFLIIFAACSIFFVVYSLLPDSMQQVTWMEKTHLNFTPHGQYPYCVFYCTQSLSSYITTSISSSYMKI